MADLRISELPPLVGTDLADNDDLPITDYSASETRRLTAKNLVQNGVARLIDDGTIPGAKVAANSIGAGQLGAGSVTEAALGSGAVTEDKIATGAVTSSKYGAASINAAAMGANSVGTTALIDGSVTAEKLADGALDGGNLAAGSVGQAALAKPSVGTPELFDASVDAAKLAGNAVTAASISPGAVGTAALADDSITTDKYQEGSVTGPVIADGVIQSQHFQTGAVDGNALAANSVTNGKIAPNTIVNDDIQFGTIEADKIASVNGGVINADSIQPASLGDVTDRGLDQLSGSIGHTNDVVAGTKFGIEYDEHGHIVAATGTLAPTDLPPATETDLGGVSVPDTSGLTVNGAGALAHANNVTANTVNGITFDAQGHVTGAVPIEADELPIATDTTIGGVSVPVGEGINVDAAGALRHTPSGIAPGIYPKVSVNATGHVVAGEQLEESDIPSIPADRIVGGTFDPALIAPDSITRDMLADYAIAYIQEAEPTAVDPGHIGILWYQESTAQLRMFNGNSWMAVGFGRLAQENLRWGGLCDADTGLITQVTEQGRTAGLEIGRTYPKCN